MEWENQDVEKFYESCYTSFEEMAKRKLGYQVFNSNDKRVYKCAIQCVRYVLREILMREGEESVKAIIRYPKYQRPDQTSNDGLPVGLKNHQIKEVEDFYNRYPEFEEYPEN